MIPSIPLSKRLLKQKKFRQMILGLVAFAILIGVITAPIERNAHNPKFTTWFNGVYWSIQTIISVGYGDVVPISTLGRVMAIILMLIGSMLFGIIVGVIGSYINRSQDEFFWNRLFERVDRLEEMMEELKKQSNYIVRSEHDIKEKK